MKLPRARHRWNLTPAGAIALQSRLAADVIETALPIRPRLVAGGDCTFADGGRTIIAGWVVWDRRTHRAVEDVIVRQAVRFPYVPGLLSFREAPALLAAARRLRNEPDLFMIDGQGKAHPRRMGLACHVGLFLDRPTLGCGKSRLCGVCKEPAARRGSMTRLAQGGEIIGRVVRTIDGVKPVIVSVGHRITLNDAVQAVLKCASRFRLPEPIRLADQLVGVARRP
ncbi:MAG: endonuclease V [Phycisphaerae bacterium]